MMISTKKEFKRAIDNKEKNFEVVAPLSNDLLKLQKFGKLSKGKIATIIAVFGLATLATPFTGGLSFIAAAPVAALTGIEIALIILASSIGILIVITAFKDYDVKTEVSIDGKNPTLKFERKKSD